jgi:hypothetical protein
MFTTLLEQMGATWRARYQPCLRVWSFTLVILTLAFLQVLLLLSLIAGAAAAPAADRPVLQPAANSHNAPVTTTLVISFPTAIDPTTVTSHTIAVHRSQQGLLTGTFVVTQTHVELTPAHPFFPGELVAVIATTRTQELSGTALITPTVWHFRTSVQAGHGTFAERSSGLDSKWSEGIALGDLDRDGDLDIFLAHRDAASSVWLNDGAGHFTTQGSDLGNSFVLHVTLGDVDGDADLDALLTGIQQHELWRNDGRGSFSYGGALFTDLLLIRAVALGDLDGDGDLDAITARMCDGADPNQQCNYATHRLWWNDGAGHFLPTPHTLGHGTVADLALGDLDQDGDLDAILVSDRSANNSAVWTNLGHGVFTVTQPLTGLLAANVALGDFDDDGDWDALAATETGAASAVWLNPGNGKLASGQTLGRLGPVEIGDLDGDGDFDAFSTTNGANKVWLNQGGATFAFAGQLLGAAQHTSSALGDLDGDGDLDAVTSAYTITPPLWVNQVAERLIPRVWLPMVRRGL